MTTRTVLAHEHRLVRPCPLCGLIDGKLLYQQHFVGHPRQDIKQCSCGMIYADSGLTQTDYDTMYRERSKYAGEFSTGSEWEFGRERLKHTVNYVSLFCRKVGEVLDFGCANGDLLAEFHEAGFEHLTGFDASAGSMKALAERGIKTVNSITATQFDCVILSHVLEHIYDVQTVFPEIIQAVKTHGVVYIEVPDAAHYSAVSPFQDFNTEHVNHFTMASLCALAGRHGLVPLHVGEKRFFVGDGVPYSAIFAVFRKMEAVSLAQYVEASEAQMDAIVNRLYAAQVGFLPELVIWGAGQLTMKLLTGTTLFRERDTSVGHYDRPLIRLFDSNKAIQGTKIGNITIEAPQLCDCPIIVGSILNAKSIETSIRARGFQNKLIFLS